jgi:hypothetical protein
MPYQKNYVAASESLAEHGLAATYYTGQFTGTSQDRTDTSLNLPFGNSQIYGKPYNVPLPGGTTTSSAPLKSAIWTGRISAPKTDSYTFWVCCDNECWLSVNGQQIVHRHAGGWDGVQQYESSSPISMTGNQWVDIEVRLSEDGVGSPTHVIIKWADSSGNRTDIPVDNMRTK